MHPEPDDFPPFLIHNGTLRKAGSEVLPIEDGAPARGQGAFETIAAYHGRPFLAAAHLGRLRRAAARLDLDCPPDHVFLDAMEILLSANRLDQEAKARIRLTLTAPPQGGASWFIEAGPVPSHGITARVVTIPYARNERGALSGLKTISYGENAVAMQLARAAGADEALFANTRDELCEGTWSNIFLYSKGCWLTPPLSSGCLPGVTRALVLELFRELGLAAKEVPIPMTDLPTAEGAFLTSSLREIQTIMAIDARELPESPDLASLREAFAERVGRETGPAPA
jgi:branched-chain amino acid aminotransferase